MHAIIPKTRCQGRWKGDDHGTAGYENCPYLCTDHCVWCSFVNHWFDGRLRRLKGCETTGEA